MKIEICDRYYGTCNSVWRRYVAQQLQSRRFHPSIGTFSLIVFSSPFLCSLSPPFLFPLFPLKKQFKFQFSAYRLQFSIGYIHLGIKISDLESLPVNLQFHFQPISCFTSDPFVQPGLCFSQVPLCSRPLASLTAHLPSYSASGAETGKKMQVIASGLVLMAAFSVSHLQGKDLTRH